LSCFKTPWTDWSAWRHQQGFDLNIALIVLVEFLEIARYLFGNTGRIVNSFLQSAAPVLSVTLPS
jgi:hypothetical protein